MDDQPSEWAKILAGSYRILLMAALLSIVIGMAMITIEFRELRRVGTGWSFTDYSWIRPYAGIGVFLIGHGLVAGFLGLFGAIGARTRSNPITKVPHQGS